MLTFYLSLSFCILSVYCFLGLNLDRLTCEFSFCKVAIEFRSTD